MPRFKLNPKAGMVFLPGHGRVKPGDVLVGEQFRRFTPNLLVEVPDPPKDPPVEVKAASKPKKPLEVPKPLAETPLETREAPTSPGKKLLTEDEEPAPPPKPKPVAKKSAPKKMVRRKTAK